MKHLLIVVALATVISAADATGTWTGTLTPADGNQGGAYLVLKQDGSTVTGTAGPNESDQHPIQNGKADDGKITFDLMVGEGVMKVALTQKGDEMAGEVTRERDGQTHRAKVAVKRSK